MTIAFKPENINIRQALAGKVSLVTGKMGPHHQHRVRARPGGITVQIRLRRRQARHRWPHQGDRA
jgi:hypothetical protein